MKQPTDGERALMELAKLMAASAKILDEKTAEATAELAALIARYEHDASGFGREAITKALIDLTLERFIKDKINVEMFRLALDQALARVDESRPMRILDSAND